jgi:hypothetical protein
LLILEFNELKQIITDKIYANDNYCEFKINCILSLANLGKSNKVIADNIVKVIMKKDGYSYYM